MIYFKACPRCVTGDVVTQKDQYGHYYLCLHCGYTAQLMAESAEPVPLAQPEAEEPVSLAV